MYPISQAVHATTGQFSGLLTAQAGVTVAAGPVNVATGTALTYVSGGTTLDTSNVARADLTLTNVTTMLGNANPSAVGDEWTRTIIQDATGGRLLTFDSHYDFGADGPPNMVAYPASEAMWLGFRRTSATKIFAYVIAQDLTP